MLSAKEGLFGVSNNKILRTTDGGKTFQDVTTPFDQAKRSNSTIANAPVDQIMRIGRFYVAKQGGMFGKYYITSYDNISWQLMPDVTYASITEAGTLMTVSSDNSVQEYDDNARDSTFLYVSYVLKECLENRCECHEDI